MRKIFSLILAPTLIQAGSVSLASQGCPRPRDFTNRVEAEKYDQCVMKSGYIKPVQDPHVLDKTSCLHETTGLVACRKKELRGESIKSVETRILGASPTPKPVLKPIDGEVPVEESTIGNGSAPVGAANKTPVTPAPPAAGSSPLN
jgi:hypothetical protein